MTRFIRSDHYSTWSCTIADSLAVQIGDTLAKITSGADTNKFGPRDLAATDGRQTVANVVGVSIMRVSAVDATGFQERVLPNQDGRLCTYASHVAQADANEAYIYNTTATRLNINSEASTPTKIALAGKGCGFIN